MSVVTVRETPISTRNGIPEREGGHGRDLRRDRRREEQRLALGGALLDDPLHVVDEAHVEHAVDLVEYEDLDGSEAQLALLEKIHEAAGGGDHDVGARAQLAALAAVADAAVEHGRPDVRETPEVAESRLHLGRELAGGLEHEDPGAALLVGAEEGQDRQREGGGLPGAGLGRGDEVLAREHDRYGAQLDRRGLRVPHGLHSAQEVGRQVKFCKRHPTPRRGTVSNARLLKGAKTRRPQGKPEVPGLQWASELRASRAALP